MTYLDEPPDTLTDPGELLLAYLDYYRSTILRKAGGLPQADLRGSRLPSGWTPLELIKHLAYMERRWIQWGFLGERVPNPWGDVQPNSERWHVGDDEAAGEVMATLAEVGRCTREAVTGIDLRQPARTGGRFPDGRQPPTLNWILLHVLQEYARHAGHLDIARELIDGSLGE